MLQSPASFVINEALAQKYFPGEDPIGQKIGNGALDPKSMREIIGIVADMREGGLDNDIWPAEYEAMYQDPAATSSQWPCALRRTRNPCCPCW